MALDPRWRRSRRQPMPALNDPQAPPSPVQWAFGILGLLGVLGLLYYLSVSSIATNFFAQSPP